MNFLLVIAGTWFLFWLGATIVEKYQQGVRDRAAHAALDNNFQYETLKQEIVAVNERAGFVKGRNTCLGCGGTLVMRTSTFGRFWGCAKYPLCRYTKKILETN